MTADVWPVQNTITRRNLVTGRDRVRDRAFRMKAAVNPCHRRAVADAGRSADLAGEVVTMQVDAVADDQAGSGLVGVQALQRRVAARR